jgi:hypothetical protein
MAIRNVFDVTGLESVVVDEQFISRPAVTSEPPDAPVAPMGPVAPIVPPPPPPVMATFNIFVMRPHLSTVICATSFASPYVPGRTDPEQHPPFAMESDIYYSGRKKHVVYTPDRVFIRKFKQNVTQRLRLLYGRSSVRLPR